jgi:tetratricopeptide (TPR) repeat protein
MKISLCMVVKNEANRLPHCLQSVRPAVDEMIVLDTGSTDETVAIAQSFGATVPTFPWNNSFADARNEALKYATGDWVLVLDADETLTPEVAPILKQAAAKKTALVINLLRQEVGAVQSPYSLVSRLFRRHPQISFSRPYHAMVDDSVAVLLEQEPHWQIIDLPQVAILHEGYTPGAIASGDKRERARITMESFFSEHPNDPYVCSKLGALYVETGDFQKGIELLEKGASSPQTDPPVRYELHYHLGIAYSRTGQPDQAEQHYRKALAQPILERLKLGAANNLGTLLQATGDLNGAKLAFEQCLKIDPHFSTGHNNLGKVFRALGQPREAIAHYQQAIALNPNYADALQNLGVVLLKSGRVQESLEAFRRAIALHAETNPAEAARLRQGLLEMGFS